ncbi:MAG TPA: hypothetical protein VD978_31480 [Azospirillum sp.]|nr:hypothetical protein [Azospirillum sp.]
MGFGNRRFVLVNLSPIRRALDAAITKWAADAANLPEGERDDAARNLIKLAGLPDPVSAAFLTAEFAGAAALACRQQSVAADNDGRSDESKVYDRLSSQLQEIGERRVDSDPETAA